MDTPAFRLVTRDLPPRSRMRFATFVERTDDLAWEDAEALLALRVTWVTSEGPGIQVIPHLPPSPGAKQPRPATPDDINRLTADLELAIAALADVALAEDLSYAQVRAKALRIYKLLRARHP